MDSRLIKRNVTRKRRVLRVRKRLRGTAEKPRLAVYKSNANIYVQLIDDENHMTIAGIGTMSKKLKDEKLSRKSKESAIRLGEHIAAVAKEKNIVKVVFDRGRFKYHGIIALLAETARKAGLQF
jgi:large subunit ribosomal protein L18